MGNTLLSRRKGDITVVETRDLGQCLIDHHTMYHCELKLGCNMFFEPTRFRLAEPKMIHHQNRIYHILSTPVCMLVAHSPFDCCYDPSEQITLLRNFRPSKLHYNYWSFLWHRICALFSLCLVVVSKTSTARQSTPGEVLTWLYFPDILLCKWNPCTEFVGHSTGLYRPCKISWRTICV